LRTTNVIERPFVEVRRRIRTICAFTTRSNCERTLFSIFDRMNTFWSRKPLKFFYAELLRLPAVEPPAIKEQIGRVRIRAVG
jgi:transposase-like protein